MDILIRNFDKHEVIKIDEVAKKKKMSREAFLKTLITNELSIFQNVITLDDHSSIRHQLANQIERNNYLLKFIQEELEDTIHVRKN